MKRRTKTEVRTLVNRIQEERKAGATLTTLLKKYSLAGPIYYRYAKTPTTETRLTDAEIISVIRSNIPSTTKMKLLTQAF